MGLVAAAAVVVVVVLGAAPTLGARTALHTHPPFNSPQPANLMDNDVLGPPLRPQEFEASLRISHATVDTSRERDPIELAGQFQGDIVLDPSTPYFRLASTDPARRWEGGVIPYVISSSYDSTERATIARAMHEIQQNTCLRFVPRTQHGDYIHLLKANGCSSSVGRVGGQQQVTLGPSCLTVGVVAHELLHVAGLWHEHSRGDRDNYITIDKANVQSDQWYNFKQYSWEDATSLGVGYDLDSVMHYGPYAFAKDRSRPTIVPRVSGTEMGQRRGLSKKDILKLQRLYGCGTGKDLLPGHATTTTPAATADLCQDLHEHCLAWSASGECSANPDWMHHQCRRACGRCGPAMEGAPCRNQHEDCSGWAQRGECRLNPDYMLPVCPAACGRC